MERTEWLRAEELAAGDAFASDPNTFIVAIYDDMDGVWVDMSDDDCGYLLGSYYTVIREYPNE